MIRTRRHYKSTPDVALVLALVFSCAALLGVVGGFALAILG